MGGGARRIQTGSLPFLDAHVGGAMLKLFVSYHVICLDDPLNSVRVDRAVLQGNFVQEPSQRLKNKNTNLVKTRHQRREFGLSTLPLDSFLTQQKIQTSLPSAVLLRHSLSSSNLNLCRSLWCCSLRLLTSSPRMRSFCRQIGSRLEALISPATALSSPSVRTP